MPLHRDAPARRGSLAETYDAMILVTHARYEGIELDDYVDLGEVEDA